MAVNTIKLEDGGVSDEGVLDTAAYPGMNIVLASDGKYDPGAGVTSATLPCIVVEDGLQGKTVSDQYAIGDLCGFLIPRRGQKVQVLAKGTGTEDIVIGDLLVADSNGLFVATGSAPAQFVAKEAKTNMAANTLVEAVSL